MGDFSAEGATLRASGDLETADLAAFEAAAERVVEGSEGEIVLDFSGVEYMPSSFLGGLMSLRSRLGRDGRRFVLKPSPVVRQLVQLTGMSASITIVD